VVDLKRIPEPLMKFLTRAALLAFVFPAVINAATAVNGNWAGRAESDDNDARLFQLFAKTEGSVLTGRVSNADGWFELERGTIVGGSVNFDAVTAVEGGAPITAFSCSGTVIEETLDLTCILGDGSQKVYKLKPHVGA
jgi:hypothetical protein